MVRKREQEHVDVALAGTNVIYAGNATSRSTLDSADVLTTTELREAVANLFKTDGAKGSAPKYSDGRWVCILHGDLLIDLQSDTTFNDTVVRQNMAKLESDPLMIMDWQGIRFYAANLFPEWENLGDATDAGNAEHDTAATITLNNSPGGATFGDHSAVVITRKHKKRLFEEGIYIVDEQDTADAGDDNSLDVTVPDTTAGEYLYNVYAGSATNAEGAATARANLNLVESNLAGGASIATLTAPPSGGAAPPAAWTADASEQIRAALVMGPEFFAVAKLQVVMPFTVPGPDSGNVLNLFTDIGAKWRDKAVITDQDYGVRIEAHTNQT